MTWALELGELYVYKYGCIVSSGIQLYEVANKTQTQYYIRLFVQERFSSQQHDTQANKPILNLSHTLRLFYIPFSFVSDI